MSLIFHNGKLLFRNGRLAMSKACCCENDCCARLNQYDHLTLYLMGHVNPDCTPETGGEWWQAPKLSAGVWGWDVGDCPNGNTGWNDGRSRLRIVCTGGTVTLTLDYPASDNTVAPPATLLPDGTQVYTETWACRLGWWTGSYAPYRGPCRAYGTGSFHLQIGIL